MRVHKSQRLIDVHLLYQPISQYKVFNLKFTSRKLYSILEANVLNYSASDLQGQYKLNLPEKKYVTSASLSWMKYCAGMGKKSILERIKVMHMMWINPGWCFAVVGSKAPPSSSLTCLPLSWMGRRIRKAEVRKLVGWERQVNR